MTAAAALFIEIRPGMRKALADAVEAFLNLLDQIDADPIRARVWRIRPRRGQCGGHSKVIGG